MYNTPTRGPGKQLVLTEHRGLILLFMGKAKGGDEFRSEQVWGTCRMEAGEKSTTGHWGLGMELRGGTDVGADGVGWCLRVRVVGSHQIEPGHLSALRVAKSSGHLSICGPGWP